MECHAALDPRGPLGWSGCGGLLLVGCRFFVSAEHELRHLLKRLLLEVVETSALDVLLVLGKGLPEKAHEAAPLLVVGNDSLQAIRECIGLEEFFRSLALVLDDAVVTDRNQDLDREVPESLLDQTECL
jgi:hypothetical protein